jgi:hypothetical protein
MENKTLVSALKYTSVIVIGFIILSLSWIVGLLFILSGVVLILNNDVMRRWIFDFTRRFISKMKESKNEKR